MKTKIWKRILAGILIVMSLCSVAYLIYDHGRPLPVPVKQKLLEGVTYRRVVQYLPQPMIAHVLVLDRKTSDFKFLVTPRDHEGDKPLKARTTSKFLDEFDVQIAVNGDGFTPWWSHNPADYYPHVGDPVIPKGLSASLGDVYSFDDENDVGVEPTLYISRQNDLSFNDPPRNIFSAISGDRMLVLKGEVAEGLDDTRRNPRTAVGINGNGRYLILVVVDGRQPFYSDGATFVQLAELLIKYGAYYGMNLDGGGSSTMVIEGENGQPVILNSPIDNYIPGRERPVANHFGVYIK